MQMRNVGMPDLVSPPLMGIEAEPWPNLVPTYPTSSFRPGSNLSDLVSDYMTTKTEISEKVVHEVLSDLVSFVLRPVNRLEKESTRLEQGLRPVRPGWWKGMYIRSLVALVGHSLHLLATRCTRWPPAASTQLPGSWLPGSWLPTSHTGIGLMGLYIIIPARPQP